MGENIYRIDLLQALNNIEKELGVELNATAAAELIVKEKCIKPYLQHELVLHLISLYMII